jgi:hypothetical protein
MFKNYVGSTINFLNQTDMPCTYLCVDPRYVLRAKDLWKHRFPKKILSQYNEVYNRATVANDKQRLSYTFSPIKVKTVYSGIETLFLYRRKKFDINKLDEEFEKKSNVFRIVLSQGVPHKNGRNQRYDALIKYIGKWDSPNCIKNVEIYGKWEKKYIGDDPRFKGTKSYDELKELMRTCKVTLILPIKPGWVTSKYIETMNGWEDDTLGIITLYGKGYDGQHHTLPRDHFLRCSPMEFKKKLKKILTDDEFCKKLYREQYKLLKEEYYTGEYFNSVVMNDVKRKQNNE